MTPPASPTAAPDLVASATPMSQRVRFVGEVPYLLANAWYMFAPNRFFSALESFFQGALWLETSSWSAVGTAFNKPDNQLTQ